MTMRARFSSPRYQYTYIHRHHPQGRCGTEGAGRAEEKVTAVRRRGPDSHPKARAGHRYIPRCLCARGTSTVEMHRIRISPRCFFLLILNIYYIINSPSIKIQQRDMFGRTVIFFSAACTGLIFFIQQLSYPCPAE